MNLALRLTLVAAIVVPVAGQKATYAFFGSAAGDNMGYAVAGAGDVNADGFDDVIVGSPGWGSQTGRADVQSGKDGSVLATYYGGALGDRFGHSVGGAGDVNGDGFDDVIVGAPNDDDGGANSGGACVLSGKDGTVLHDVDGLAANDNFGAAVSGAGDVDADGYEDFIVGAPQSLSGGTGYARVFSGLGGMLYHWNGDSAGDWFGFSVSGAGDVTGDGFADLIVGAPKDDDNGSASGSARIFSGVDGSIWGTFHGDSPTDNFGLAVGGAGDVNRDGLCDLIVGAPLDDLNGTNSGSTRVLSGATGSTLHLFNGDLPDDQLGWSVSGMGDIDGDGYDDVAVGTPFTDVNGADSGSVRVYSGVDGRIVYTFDGSSAGSYLGHGGAASCAGDVNCDGYPDLITGAFGDNTNGVDAGTAVVYTLQPLVTVALAATFTGTSAGEQFGHSVSDAGDVNCDGYADVIIGARYWNNVTGRAEVRSGKDGAVLWTFYGGAASDNFGASVSAAGDVDADGIGDVVVGAYQGSVTPGTGPPGYARVFSGKTGAVIRTFNGSQAGEAYGWSVSGAGDVNGDGHSDVIVGAFQWNNISGRVELRSGKDGVVLWSSYGTASAALGGTVRGGGDVNGDGVPDVIAGAPGYNALGRAYVYSGASGATLYTFDNSNTGPCAVYTRFAVSVDIAGDVNRDGYADLIVGCRDTGSCSLIVGRAEVFSGKDGNLLHTFSGALSNTRFGEAVSGAGDVDGDGFADLLVGERQNNSAGAFAGAVWVYSGRNGSTLHTLYGTSPDQLGWSVSGAGDVNGDGLDDIVASAPFIYASGGKALLFTSVMDSDPGKFATYGAGCPGSDGRLPRIGNRLRPVIGQSFDITLASAPRSAGVFLGIGAGQTAVELTFLGMPGCTALTLPLLLLPSVTSAAGAASWNLPVPHSPSSVGVAVQFQWIAIDLLANPAGLIESDGGNAIFGRL